MFRKYLTNSPRQTKKIGFVLAETLKKCSRKKALALGLEGDLGGGKTTFLQGFARGLGVKSRILSPTFIIIRRVNDFYHIDCYRLQGSKELLSLGFKKIVANPKNIVVIEWADRVRKIIPQDATWVKFEFVGRNKRRIVVKSKDGKEKTPHCF